MAMPVKLEYESLENNLKKLLRKTARKFVEEEIDQVKVSKDDLPDMLGRKDLCRRITLQKT